MTGAPSHGPFLQQVAAELEAAGGVPGEDFFVHFVTEGAVSGDFYGLRPTGDGRLEVYYSDRGERRVLTSTTDPDTARAVLRERVLAAVRRRGRG